MLSRRWLSQRQGRAHTELAARKEHRPKTKASPAVGVTITFAKRQTHITQDPTIGRPQVWSRGSIPGWLYTTGVIETSVFISRSRNQRSSCRRCPNEHRATLGRGIQPEPGSHLRTRNDNSFDQGFKISVTSKLAAHDGRNKTQTEARKPHIAWRNGVDGGGATERRSRIEASNLPYIDVRET